ncbi:MAG: HD domain-containing protein [Fusobacteriaceae bacterium]|jgi:putative nucleotidyltransferase with HDIG domain|nr:HD domain-containing protein [Fusobacteriaceae bacterium]
MNILENTQHLFTNYIKNYDLNQVKIKLKAVHTYHVMDIAERIAISLGLSPDDIELAQVIGLLHDIGRFEQVRLFNSFDDRNFSHAKYSIKILFEDNLIDNITKDETKKNIIYNAIKYHSDFILDATGVDERTLLHERLIRDADKLDIFRVILNEDLITITNLDRNEISHMSISEDVLKSLFSYESINRNHRRNKLDVILTFLGFIFDVNFKESFKIILEQKYIEQITEKILELNPALKETVEQIRSTTILYCQEKILPTK